MLVAHLACSAALVAVPAAPALAQLTSIPPAPPATSIPAPTRPPDAIDRARSRAMEPLPRSPRVPVPERRWVPERRFYSAELGREIVVPGHYETRITDQQYSVPPLTGYGPQGQNPVAIPGGERPPADLRQGP